MADLERTAAAARAVVAERGPLRWSAVRDELTAAGYDDLPRGLLRSELAEVLHDELDVRIVGNDELLATAGQIYDGVVATHRLSEAEAANGFVLSDPDLALLLYDVAVPALVGPLGERVERVGGPLPGIGLDDEEEALLGPSGWLGPVTAGDVLAFRLVGEQISFERVADLHPDDDLPARILAAFDDAKLDDGTTIVGHVLSRISALDPSALRVPRRPVGELLADSGLAIEGDWLGPPGHDWKAYWEAKREAHAEELADEHGLDELDGRLLADLIVLAARFRSGATFTDDEWEGAAVALVAADVTEALCEAHNGNLGLFGDNESAEKLRELAEAVVARYPRRHPPGALVTMARCDEMLGDLAAAERSLRRALEVDPDFQPALRDLSWIAALRGDPGRALALLLRTSPFDEMWAGVLQHFAAPGRASAGRNEPCPCGSGAKHKQCCGPFGGHPLARRALFLHQKALMWASRALGRRARLPLAVAAAGVDSYWDDPDYALAAMVEEDLVSLHLFGGDGMVRFVETAGALLPHDELRLAEEWAKATPRVWMVVERPNDGSAWTVRDVGSGDVCQVVDMPGASWTTGELLLAAAVPLDAAGSTGLLGAVRTLTTAQADDVITRLGGGAGIEEIAEVVVGPLLDGIIASYGALSESQVEAQRRMDWLFPESELTPADLDDPDDLAMVLEDWDLWGDPDLAPEPAAAAAANVAFEIAVRQLVDDDPPEAWETAGRLRVLGYDRVDVLRMVASTLVPQLAPMAAGERFDLEAQIAALAALPGEYERWSAEPE